MRRLVCAFVVRKRKNQDVSRRGLYYIRTTINLLVHKYNTVGLLFYKEIILMSHPMQFPFNLDFVHNVQAYLGLQS